MPIWVCPSITLAKKISNKIIKMNDDITAIDLRLSRVENDIGTERIKDHILLENKAKEEAEIPPHVIDEVKTVIDSHKEHIEKYHQFDAFFETYEKLETYFKSNQPLIDILSQPHKEDIVVCAQDDVKKTAAMLKVMEEIRPLLDKAIVKHLPALQEKVDRLEAQCHVHLDEVASFHSELDDTLDAYNRIIDLLSNKFLYWNKKVVEWEAKIARKSGH